MKLCEYSTCSLKYFSTIPDRSKLVCLLRSVAINILEMAVDWKKFGDLKFKNLNIWIIWFDLMQKMMNWNWSLVPMIEKVFQFELIL
jgi:hypothetical protein